MLQRAPYSDEDVLTHVARFASRFGPEHKGRLLSYIRAKKTRANTKELAIKTLAAMKQTVPADTLHEIINCLQSSDECVRYGVYYFLGYRLHHLGKEHVKRILEIYESDSTNEAVPLVICDIPPQLLAEHTDLFINLLGHQEAYIQISILNILVHLASELQPLHIKKVEKLLHNTDYQVHQVQRLAYTLLKETYKLCGLPA